MLILRQIMETIKPDFILVRARSLLLQVVERCAYTTTCSILTTLNIL